MQCPVPDQRSLSCLLIKLHFWLFSWVSSSLYCVSVCVVVWVPAAGGTGVHAYCVGAYVNAKSPAITKPGQPSNRIWGLGTNCWSNPKSGTDIGESRRSVSWLLEGAGGPDQWLKRPWGLWLATGKAIIWSRYQKDLFAHVCPCVWGKGETRGSRSPLSGRPGIQGQLLEGSTVHEVGWKNICTCVCMHVSSSEYQQLPWGCVPRASHAQVPPAGETEDPGPATGQSVCLRPATGGFR